MRSSQTKIRMAPVSSPMAARIGGFRKPLSALYFSSRIVASTIMIAPIPVKSFTPTNPSQSKVRHEDGFFGGVKLGGGGGGGRTGTSVSGSEAMAAAAGCSIGVSTIGGGGGTNGVTGS